MKGPQSSPQSNGGPMDSSDKSVKDQLEERLAKIRNRPGYIAATLARQAELAAHRIDSSGQAEGRPASPLRSQSRTGFKRPNTRHLSGALPPASVVDVEQEELVRDENGDWIQKRFTE